MIEIKNVLVLDVGSATKEDLIKVDFTRGEESVYVWFNRNSGKWFINTEFAPMEVWTTAAQLHHDGFNTSTAQSMKGGFENVVLGVSDSGFQTLQPAQVLCISYHYPLQQRTTHKNYGSSHILTISVTSRDEVRNARRLGTS